MIELSTRKWATIKKTAQIVQPNVAKAQKLQEQIAKLTAELDEANAAIAEWDGAIVRMTGHTSAQLIKRVVTPVKQTEDGKILTVTKWIPSDIVVFDEENNVYRVCDDANAVEGDCEATESEPTNVESESAE